MIKRPMKGEQIEDLSLLIFPLYAFPKIDGFRCILGQYPMTSRLSRFPNSSFHQEGSDLLPEGYYLDGEVVVGKKRGEGVLGRTSSGLTTLTDDPDWTIWVFDTPLQGYGFNDRYTIAKQVVDRVNHPRIRLLKCKLIKNLEQLQAYIDKQLAKGYEGVMVRSPDGPYKEGKSTIKQGYLLKIKPFEDFEARITGYFEEMENTNEAKRDKTGKQKRSSAKAGKKGKGTLGGFIGEELDNKGKPTGRTIRVGGGFTKRQREDYWAIKDELVAASAIIKCKKQKVGEKDKPRHPGFVALRPDWDMSV